MCSSNPSSAAAPCSISPAERPHTAASIASDPANVIVDGPYSSPARVSRATVRGLGQRVAAAVGDRDQQRRRGEGGEALGQPHQLGALARLADGDHDSVGRDSGQTEVEELSGVDHRDRRAASRELGHGGVTGVVAAAHPREDDARRRGHCVVQAVEPRACADRPPAARRIASGWPAISAINLSGNFPNDFATSPEYRRIGRRVGIKIAVIGGGSTYTPELIEGFGLRRDVLPVDELVLHDIDPERLEVVGGLAERILRKLEFPGRLTLTRTAKRRSPTPPSSSFSSGWAGSRPGSATRRSRRVTAASARRRPGPAGSPRRCGRCRWCWRSQSDTARLGAPGAWLLDFTNPAGLVTQALSDDGHRAIGLCNIPIGFQREFANQLGVSPDSVQLEHVGLNHLSGNARCWSTARTGCPAADRDLCRPDGGGGRHARRPGAPDALDPLLLPALLLLHAGDGRQAAIGAAAGRRGDGDRARAPGDVPPIRSWT